MLARAAGLAHVAAAGALAGHAGAARRTARWAGRHLGHDSCRPRRPRSSRCRCTRGWRSRRRRGRRRSRTRRRRRRACPCRCCWRSRPGRRRRRVHIPRCRTVQARRGRTCVPPQQGALAMPHILHWPPRPAEPRAGADRCPDSRAGSAPGRSPSRRRCCRCRRSRRPALRHGPLATQRAGATAGAGRAAAAGVARAGASRSRAARASPQGAVVCRAPGRCPSALRANRRRPPGAGPSVSAAGARPPSVPPPWPWRATPPAPAPPVCHPCRPATGAARAGAARRCRCRRRRRPNRRDAAGAAGREDHRRNQGRSAGRRRRSWPPANRRLREPLQCRSVRSASWDLAGCVRCGSVTAPAS